MSGRQPAIEALAEEATALRDTLASEQAARRDAEECLARVHAQLDLAAHDLRNPLTSISLNAQLALRHMANAERIDAERMARALRAIVSHAASISTLVDRLQDDARRQMDA